MNLPKYLEKAFWFYLVWSLVTVFAMIYYGLKGKWGEFIPLSGCLLFCSSYAAVLWKQSKINSEEEDF